jgi:hypothetical protein
VPGRVAEGRSSGGIDGIPEQRVNPGANDRSAIEVMATRPVADLADTPRTWERPRSNQRVSSGRLNPQVSDPDSIFARHRRRLARLPVSARAKAPFVQLLAATMASHVVYESQVELARLLLADFDQRSL